MPDYIAAGYLPGLRRCESEAEVYLGIMGPDREEKYEAKNGWVREQGPRRCWRRIVLNS
jgi:hypothetical protein